MQIRNATEEANYQSDLSAIEDFINNGNLSTAIVVINLALDQLIYSLDEHEKSELESIKFALKQEMHSRN